MRAAFRVVIAAVATVLVAVSAAPALAQFMGALSLTSVSVAAADTDGSGLWDVVFVNATVDVTTEGFFDFQATMAVPNPNVTGFYQCEVSTQDVNWTAGDHGISLRVSTDYIAIFHADGPYRIMLSVSGLQPDGLAYPITVNQTVTPAWRASQFDGVPVSIGGPITDQGMDVHGEGHFDELVVHVPLHVTRNSMAYLYGILQTSGGQSLTPDLQPWRQLGPGDYMGNFTFNAVALYTWQADGPFNVTVALYMARESPPAFHLVDTTWHTTAAYSWRDLARPDADFRGTPTLAPVDTNGNGKADFLDPHVPLRVRTAGNYSLTVTVCPSCGFFSAVFPARFIYLPQGDVAVDDNLSGVLLSGYPATPNFGVTVGIRSLDAPYFDYNSTSVVYPAFDPTAFESRLPQTLTLNVSGPGYGGCVFAYALDETTKAVVSSPAGPYPVSLPVYNGTLDVLVQSCYPYAVGVVRRVTVAGPTVVDMSIPSYRAYEARYGVNLQGWDRATADVSTTWAAASPIIRW